jgi:hypothetical protein
MSDLQEKEFSTEKRGTLADEGKAMPDGSFPIENEGDLKNAIQSIGRAKDPAGARAHIKKRAKALGLLDLLPDAWKESTAPRAGYFAELTDLQEAVLDEAQFIARGVTLIRPGFSKNVDRQGRPRYYSPDLLKQSAAKFDGVRAYANHPRRSDEKELPERDIKDIVGYYENVAAADDGVLRGDFRVVGAARQWLWPLIAETPRKPDLVELSINALGETTLGKVEDREAVLISSIVKGNSVDVVTSGAAGGTFKGALLASDPDQWTSDLLEAMPFEQWRTTKPEYVQKLQTEWVTVRQTEALKTAEATTEAIRTELTTLQEKYQADTGELVQLRRAAMADRILEAGGLPIQFRKALREELVKLETEEAMIEAAERETRKYKAAPKEKIVIDRGVGVVVKETHAPVKTVKPAVVLFGLNESKLPLPNETAEEYKARIQSS